MESDRERGRERQGWLDGDFKRTHTHTHTQTHTHRNTHIRESKRERGKRKMQDAFNKICKKQSPRE